MHYTNAKVYLIGEPQLHWGELYEYLKLRDALEWYDSRSDDTSASDAEIMVETAGRLCYRSWKPGLNPNVTRVRADRTDYFENIMKSAHGSILEHAMYNFILADVSRVVTHELVRHRVGTAVSQESLRFVRLEDIPFFMPEWAQEDEELMLVAGSVIQSLETAQHWMAQHFGLDEPGISFHEKKHKTSFMRRLAPEGLTTDLMWSANARTLRHTIDVRTDHSAEEEIRIVFGQIAEIMQKRAPLLFADFINDDGHWTPDYRKV